MNMSYFLCYIKLYSKLCPVVSFYFKFSVQLVYEGNYELKSRCDKIFDTKSSGKPTPLSETIRVKPVLLQSSFMQFRDSPFSSLRSLIRISSSCCREIHVQRNW
jgi:hypothetical protein